MSDDLVKRLRELDDDSFVETMHGTAADRIEELEGMLAKAVEALELALELADNDLVDFSEYGLSCDADINERYRTTLAELKGQDDE